MLRSHARGKSGVPFVSKVHKLEHTTFERLGERERGWNKWERFAHPPANGDHRGRCLEQAMKGSLESEGSRNRDFIFLDFCVFVAAAASGWFFCRCLIFFLLLPTELLVIWQRFIFSSLLAVVVMRSQLEFTSYGLFTFEKPSIQWPHHCQILCCIFCILFFQRLYPDLSWISNSSVCGIHRLQIWKIPHQAAVNLELLFFSVGKAFFICILLRLFCNFWVYTLDVAKCICAGYSLCGNCEPKFISGIIGTLVLVVNGFLFGYLRCAPSQTSPAVGVGCIAEG
jgi:hypothetical protein